VVTVVTSVREVIVSFLQLILLANTAAASKHLRGNWKYLSETLMKVESRNELCPKRKADNLSADVVRTPGTSHIFDYLSQLTLIRCILLLLFYSMWSVFN